MAIGTGANGIDPAGDISVYAAGQVTVIDRGTAMVTYGPPITLQPGQSFPNVGIFNITAGEMTADNLVFARTVTITPA